MSVDVQGWYDVGDVAGMFRVTPRTVQRWAREQGVVAAVAVAQPQPNPGFRRHLSVVSISGGRKA